jgi:hypothetical protein
MMNECSKKDYGSLYSENVNSSLRLFIDLLRHCSNSRTSNLYRCFLLVVEHDMRYISNVTRRRSSVWAIPGMLHILKSSDDTIHLLDRQWFPDHFTSTTGTTRKHWNCLGKSSDDA